MTDYTLSENRLKAEGKEGPLIWFFSEEQKSSDFVGYVMLQDAFLPSYGFCHRQRISRAGTWQKNLRRNNKTCLF